MSKFYLLLYISMIICVTTNAQPKTISGYLLDSITHFPVTGGTITNTTNKAKAYTDQKGFFRINVSPKDFINVLAKFYRYHSLSVPNLFADSLTVFLSPSAIFFLM